MTLGKLLLFIFIVPAIEMWTLIEVGSEIGVLETITLLILTGMLGVFLIKRQGLQFVMNIQKELSKGQAPTHSIISGLTQVLAGILLFIPGFWTDAFALLLLIPFTSKLLMLILTQFIFSKIRQGHVHIYTGTNEGWREVTPQAYKDVGPSASAKVIPIDSYKQKKDNNSSDD